MTSSYAVQYTNGDHAWAEEFSTPGAEWAGEFDRAQATAAAARVGGGASQSAAMEQTRALRDTLAASKDPKFQNSQFLQFVSKMSRGEIILEDNQVCVSHAPTATSSIAGDLQCSAW